MANALELKEATAAQNLDRTLVIVQHTTKHKYVLREGTT
jgi:hypothetical protein